MQISWQNDNRYQLIYQVFNRLSIYFIKHMPHTCLLGVHIKPVVLVRSHFNRHILDYFQIVAFKAYTLHRVIGNKPHVSHSKFMENIGTNSIIAFIGLEAKMQICFYCIKPILLKLICLYFVHQTYTTAFLTHI